MRRRLVAAVGGVLLVMLAAGCEITNRVEVRFTDDATADVALGTLLSDAAVVELAGDLLAEAYGEEAVSALPEDLAVADDPDAALDDGLEAAGLSRGDLREVAQTLWSASVARGGSDVVSEIGGPGADAIAEAEEDGLVSFERLEEDGLHGEALVLHDVGLAEDEQGREILEAFIDDDPSSPLAVLADPQRERDGREVRWVFPRPDGGSAATETRLPGLHTEFMVTVPGEVVRTNAPEVDGQTVAWELAGLGTDPSVTYDRGGISLGWLPGLLLRLLPLLVLAGAGWVGYWTYRNVLSAPKPEYALREEYGFVDDGVGSLTEQLPPAGWYADPSGDAAERWWDGGSWTEMRR